MASEFHKRVISRITPEERALMVKSLEIISKIHSILDSKNITQKELAGMLNISPPAVSKMLCPGANLGLNTVVRLELLLGEPILTTPEKETGIVSEKEENWGIPPKYSPKTGYMQVVYKSAESTYAQISCAN